MAQFHISIQWLISYIGTGFHIWLLGAALLYLLLFEHEAPVRRLFLGYSAVWAVLYFCPVTPLVLGKLIGNDIYWRCIWLLPMPVIIAFAMVKAWERIQKTWQKAGLILLFVCLICITGKNVYFPDGHFEKAYNLQKVPVLTATADAIIHENLEEDEPIVMLATSNISDYIRQYDPQVRQLYGRRSAVGGFRNGSIYINRPVVNTKTVCRFAIVAKCNFIVLPKAATDSAIMSAFQYEVVGEVGEYYVWKNRALYASE